MNTNIDDDVVVLRDFALSVVSALPANDWLRKAAEKVLLATDRASTVATPVMEKYPSGWDGVDENCQAWLKSQPNGTRLYAGPVASTVAKETPYGYIREVAGHYAGFSVEPLGDDLIAGWSQFPVFKHATVAKDTAGEVYFFKQKASKTWIETNRINWLESDAKLADLFDVRTLYAAPISEDTNKTEQLNQLLTSVSPSERIAAFRKFLNLEDMRPAAPSVSIGDALPPLPAPDKIHHDELHGESHYWDEDTIRAYLLADRAARTVNTSIGDDQQFSDLLAEYVDACEKAEKANHFLLALPARDKLCAFIDSRQPCQTEPAKAVVFWDKAVGGFYIGKASVPESIKNRVTPLCEVTQSPAQVNAVTKFEEK